MNKLDNDYQDLLSDVLEDGVEKQIEPEQVLYLYLAEVLNTIFQMVSLF